MKRISQVNKLKGGTVHHLLIIHHTADKLEKFMSLYKSMPKEVQSAIHACGFKNYSVFHYNGALFTYLEYTGGNLNSDLEKMSKTPSVAAFNAGFAGIIEGEWFSMEACYSMD